MSRQGKPDPPHHLSEASKELWRQVVPERISTGRLAMVTAALEARDRAEECRLVIEREGMTTKTESTGALHLHPLLRVEKDNRQLFTRLWQQLRLHFDPTVDGRRM